jgi:hypothetical protein
LSDISQLYVKGEVPDEGIVPVNVSDWSASMYCADTVGAPGAVTWDDTIALGDAEEVAVSGEVAESVTFSSNEYVLPVTKVLAGTLHVTVFPDACPVPEFAAHCVACA